MFNRTEKKKITEFEKTSRKELAKKRLALLENRKVALENDQQKKDEYKKILIQIKILVDLIDLFPDENDNVKDKEIFDTVIKHTKGLYKSDSDEPDPDLSPFVYIKRYSLSEQYEILPDAMQSNFDDIPDENGMTKDELVETIQRFGEILNNITNKERDLTSKLDCSLYAEQFLDTLEQIATLYQKRVIPKKAADYFENKFSYGINLLNWYNQFVIKEGCICEITTTDKSCSVCGGGPEFDPKEIVFEDDKEERWSEFKWFCRGAEDPTKNLTKFNDEKRLADYVEAQIRFLNNEIINFEKEITKLTAENKPTHRTTVLVVIFKEILNTLSINTKNSDIADIIKDKNDELIKLRKSKEDAKLTDVERDRLDKLTKIFVKSEKETSEYNKLVKAKKLTDEEYQDLRTFVLRDFITNFGKGDEASILPDTMYEYNLLPAEEGMKPNEVLDLMRKYNDQLNQLAGKETSLQTKIDCSIYAEQFLDTLEEIAYLFNNKTIATDALTFFENNFSYGQTLKKWYDKMVMGASSQDERWKEFEIYCREFKDEYDVPAPIKSFGVLDSLPPAMIFYEELPFDLSECKKRNFCIDYSKNDKWEEYAKKFED